MSARDVGMAIKYKQIQTQNRGEIQVIQIEASYTLYNIQAG